MLDETRATVMTERRNWSMQASDGRYILDLEWKGQANGDRVRSILGRRLVRSDAVHVDDRAEAVSSNGQRDKDAEAQRTKWVDLEIQVDGRNGLVHVVIFNSPDNSSFPVV